jgi:hypothetical protein
MQSYVTQGKSAEDLQPFPDLESFLTYVGGPGASYDRAVLYLQGTKGIDLGIRLFRDQKRLELSSSLERKQFNNVVALFEDQIDLKLLKEQQPSSSEADNLKGAGLLEKLFFAVVPALVLAWGGVEGFKGWQKQYAVEIVFPPKLKDGESKVVGPEIQINWTVQVTQWWNTSESKPGLDATVRVFNESGHAVLEAANKNPLFNASLRPGKYTVEVEVPQVRKRDRVPITIEAAR